MSKTNRSPIKKIPTGIYKHYKGKKYKVIGIAHHSETLEPLVVYQAQYTSPDFGKNAIWVRPVKMFTEKIIVDGKKVARFNLLKK